MSSIARVLDWDFAPRSFGGGGGGSAQPATTTTTTELSKEQKKLFDLAFPSAEAYVENPPELYGESLVSPFDPLQTAGQEQVLSAAAGPQQSLADTSKKFTEFALSDALDVNTNPYLQKTIEAAVRPITQSYEQEVLPNVRSGAITAGQYGGSRQDRAEQTASDNYLRQVGDTSSQIATRGYETGLDTALKALGFLPSTVAAQTTPGTSTSAVGDIRQIQSQNLLNEAAFRDFYEQTAPFLAGKEALGISAAIPGGSTTVTGVPGRASPTSQAISSALGGATLAAGLGYGGPGGLAVGGSLGLLASLFS